MRLPRLESGRNPARTDLHGLWPAKAPREALWPSYHHVLMKQGNSRLRCQLQQLGTERRKQSPESSNTYPYPRGLAWGGNRRVRRSKRPPPTGKPIGKGRGRSPPPFPLGLPVGGGHLDPQNRRFPAPGPKRAIRISLGAPLNRPCKTMLARRSMPQQHRPKSAENRTKAR